MKDNTSIIVHDLAIGYTAKRGNHIVAENLNLTLEKGRLHGIVGINGIGKSTLLRTLGRVQPRLSGKILVNGQDVDQFTAQELATKISIVLTEPIASKNMTVLEVIALGRQPYTNWIGILLEEDKQKIKTAVDVVGLNDLQENKCHELSDGQLQRVMIARALAQDTDIILLDEPTTHLDLHHKVRILKLLKSIAHQTKKCILFTTHEIELALQLCDKMLLLDLGRNPFGTPEKLIEQKAFDELFPTSTVIFDSLTRMFKIQP